MEEGIVQLQNLFKSFHMEFWIALPNLYFIAGLRRILDAMTFDVQGVGGRLKFGEDFVNSVEDWLWRFLCFGFAYGLASVSIKAGILEGNAFMLGLLHGGGSLLIFHLLKWAKLLQKFGLAKE